MTTPTVIAPRHPLTLGDLLPLRDARVRDATLVIGFALLTAVAAQVRFSLGFTPVPITGQTFAVLLAGGVLGPWRGAASQAVYIGLGLVGLPFYTGGEHGWDYATGSTAGYLVGFVIAAAVVGLLAQRRQDRDVVTAVPAMLFGAVIIQLCGAVWLMQLLDVPMYSADGPNALELGWAPFVVGDVLKVALAGVLLPVAWRLRRD